MNRSEEEWKKLLSAEQYRILRQKGTEPPFTGVYLDNHDKGIYRCAACEAELFSSEHKFESGSGWPSFFCPVKSSSVKEEKDTAHSMVRTEVLCPQCGSHLGHVFEDGPAPTGLRYCINSGALKFEKR